MHTSVATEPPTTTDRSAQRRRNTCGQRRRGRPRVAALRLRYRRHFRHDGSLAAGVHAQRQPPGLYRIQRAARDDGRLAFGGATGGLVGPAAGAGDAGGAVRRLGGGLCAGLELVCLDFLPLAGRSGGRRGIRRLPDVYHRDCTRPATRAAGGDQPVEHRGGNSGGVPIQLPGRPRGGRRPSEHVAMDVWGHDRPRGGFPVHGADDPGKPALAGQARAPPTSRGSASPLWARKPGSGSGRDRGITESRDERGRTSGSSSASISSHCCWRA